MNQFEEKYFGKVVFNRRKRAIETHKAILEYCKDHGHTPTRQALADSMGLTTGGINKRLVTLKEFELISFDEKNGQMIVSKSGLV